MKIPTKSYDWALNHLLEQGDTDIFPRPFEFECMKQCWSALSPIFSGLDIEDYVWHGSRRFVVPKEETSFRMATQLSPIDSLVLAAIIKDVGEKIESHRFPSSSNHVFSYRFMPTLDGEFFARHMVWNEFWTESKNKATKYSWVAISDISDLYNQISHHSVENQLDASGVPREAVESIINLLKMVTGTVSRGIPVGSHAVHMLSECTLNEIDRSIVSRGYDHCRYVDDIHIFVESREEAVQALFDLAEILDKQQRLVMNKQKTEIRSSEQFAELADEMLTERPINFEEEELLQLIRKYSRGDNYRKIKPSKISAADLAKFTETKVNSVLEAYIRQEPRDSTRLSWFIRRLAQIGTSSGMGYMIQNIVPFLPCIGSVAKFIATNETSNNGDGTNLGGSLLNALDNSVVSRNDYVQMVLLHLFSTRPALNQIDRLTATYSRSSPSSKREIVRAAAVAKRTAFIRERKDEYNTADFWLRNAIIEGTSCLTADERNHWLKSLQGRMTPTEQIVAAAITKTPSFIRFDARGLCEA